jgi:hypothetical protein
MEKRSADKNPDPRRPAQGRANPKGHNPKAGDSPDRDVHHDENRRNLYDEEVARGLRGSGRAD